MRMQKEEKENSSVMMISALISVLQRSAISARVESDIEAIRKGKLHNISIAKIINTHSIAVNSPDRYLLYSHMGSLRHYTDFVLVKL